MDGWMERWMGKWMTRRVHKCSSREHPPLERRQVYFLHYHSQALLHAHVRQHPLSLPPSLPPPSQEQDAGEVHRQQHDADNAGAGGQETHRLVRPPPPARRF